MKKVYCCKEGGKRFGKTCLTNGYRGSNGFCKYASEIHPLDWVNNLIRNTRNDFERLFIARGQAW